jgi:hypothetical protein
MTKAPEHLCLASSHLRYGMSVTESRSNRLEHPVDVIEQIAAGNAWAFDREEDDEISITVAGSWTDYQLAFTWLPHVEALHLGCAFDLRVNERHKTELQRLIALLNAQLWVGHFGHWEQENVILFRHALLLTNGAQPDRSQCEAVLHAAISACERYYQSFQFVLWSGKRAEEALEAAMFETVGEA